MINLFTVPPQPAPSTDGPSAVLSAIREGSGASGADFDYLVRTAGRESAFNPNAKAETSTASGLFQFVDQTWLRMVKTYGESVGLAAQSRAIMVDGAGRLVVADATQRAAILNLRHDPKLATAMAGFLTRENAQSLSSSLGRKVSMEELYIAHVLGASGAADLIKLSRSDPERPARALFAEAARANPALFFDRVSGQAKSLAGVRDGLAEAYHRTGGDFASLASIDDTYVDVPVEIKTDQSKSLYLLFQNKSNIRPLNAYVSEMWQSPDLATGSSRPSYFPHSATAFVAYDAHALPPLPDTHADVPLPPRRPALFVDP